MLFRSATVFDPNDFGFYIPDVWEQDAFLNAYRAVSQGGGSPALVAAQQAYTNSIQIRDRLKPLHVDDKNPLPPTPMEYPKESELGKGLKNLARMLSAGFGTRVATMSAGGGYDTHDQQEEKHPKLLKDLGDSLEA